MNDPEAMKLFSPKSKPKESAASPVKSPFSASVEGLVPVIPTRSGLGFKKGTGYGGNHGDSSWDVEAWAAAQAKRESEVIEIAQSLAIELEKANVPKSLAIMIEASSLIPFLQQYLANDSISDMDRHAAINHTILDICQSHDMSTTLDGWIMRQLLLMNLASFSFSR